MKILVTFVLPFLTDCLYIKTKNYDATEGDTIDFTCYYDPGYKDYTKYWCKGYYKSSCTILCSTGDITDEGVWIKDQATEGEITVTMYNLKPGDTDWYWCGIERSSLLDIMDYTHLTVAKGSAGSGGSMGSGRATVYYVLIPVLGIVVLLFIAALTVGRIMRKKSTPGQNPKHPMQQGKPPDIFVTQQSDNSDSPITYATILVRSNKQPQERKTLDFPGTNQDGTKGASSVEYSEIAFRK